MTNRVRVIDRLLPNFGVKNISLYYLITIFSTAWFIIANWLFFVLKFVTPTQIGIIESISFGIGLLLEIPSGAIADLLGKKITVQTGLFMQTIGVSLFLFSSYSVWFIAIGNVIIISSFAMVSGAFEALAYDSMVENKIEKHYDDVAAKVSSISPIVFIITAIAGGILWGYSIYLPWIATLICFAIALFLSFKLTEPAVDTYKFSWKQFVEQNKVGLQQLQIPQIRKHLPILLSLLAGYYMWSTGIIRIFMGEQFGYDGETLSYLVSFTMIVSSVAIYYFNSIKRKLGDTKGILVLTAIGLVGWILAGIFSNTLLIGMVVFLCITVTGQLSSPWRSTIINKYIDSKYRATTISTLQFFIQIPYVIIALVFGTMIESNVVQIFYLFVGMLMLMSILWSTKYKVRFRLQKVMEKRQSLPQIELPSKINPKN